MDRKSIARFTKLLEDRQRELRLDVVKTEKEMRTAQHDYGQYATPSVWRSNRAQAAARVEALSSNGMDEIEIPAFLRKQAD